MHTWTNFVTRFLTSKCKQKTNWRVQAWFKLYCQTSSLIKLLSSSPTPLHPLLYLQTKGVYIVRFWRSSKWQKGKSGHVPFHSFSGIISLAFSRHEGWATCEVIQAPLCQKVMADQEIKGFAPKLSDHILIHCWCYETPILFGTIFTYSFHWLK